MTKIKIKVIKNLPVRLPVLSTILYSFLLDYYNASGIIWGVFITLFSLIWVVVIIAKFKEEKIDITNILDKENDKN